jgi:hypothetical protein
MNPLGLLVLLLIGPGASVSKKAETIDAQAFAERAGGLRQVWGRLNGKTVKSIQKEDKEAAGKALADLERSHRRVGGCVVTYMRFRLTLLEDVLHPEDLFRDRLSALATACEELAGYRELFSNDRTTQFGLLDCNSELNPLTRWAGPSFFQSRDHGFVHPAPPTIPATGRNELVEVADHLRRAGLYDHAWRAFAEAVYVWYAPPWTRERTEETWVHPEAAALWAGAATCAQRAGKDELAADFLMKAAVFGTNELYSQCLKEARQWWAPDGVKQREKEVPVSPELKREALTKAVRLYMAMNAHPRAWALIDEYPEAFETPDDLRKEVQADWVGIVNIACKFTFKLVIFGYEVYPKGDSLAVKIPLALSDEGLANARRRLARLLQDRPPRSGE